jgi:hypothetical protein
MLPVPLQFVISMTASAINAPQRDAAMAVQREMEELARQLETASPEELDVLARLLCHDDPQDYERLLSEVKIRKGLRAYRSRGAYGLFVLGGAAILVATVMRVGFFAVRPFVGFGLLGGMMLLWGLRGWHLASEVRERMLMIEVDAKVEEEDRATRADQAGDRPRSRPCRK